MAVSKSKIAPSVEIKTTVKELADATFAHIELEAEKSARACPGEGSPDFSWVKDDLVAKLCEARGVQFPTVD